MNYDINVDVIDSLPTKNFSFLRQFVVASLPVTGFLIWKGRKKKKNPNVQVKKAFIM